MKKTFFIAGLLLLGSTSIHAQEAEKTNTETTVLPEVPAYQVVESKVEEKPTTEATMSAAELKAFKQEQKQIERERKAEIKKQKEIAKTQKNIQKATAKLNKITIKYNKENDAYNRDMALGKIAPIEELKIKTKLHKYQTEIANLEFDIKAEEYKYEALTK
ncbi:MULTISPECIES: hypothetical protein [unclassified Myroides]|uniref:hypothetical protein n=1 Tax=unclassified Myroides TaxID=2642485 RepID=UPI0015F9BFBC|nr:MULTISPECIES: hypothetical protein [unclassified Myroides]MBB1148818.1 hypothetical protein [Myroides sp. NP-2]MDM1406528.1 hypothetical protein [Myroides sp. DF42-4-2]